MKQEAVPLGRYVGVAMDFGVEGDGKGQRAGGLGDGRGVEGEEARRGVAHVVPRGGHQAGRHRHRQQTHESHIAFVRFN